MSALSLTTPTEEILERAAQTGARPFDWDFASRWWWNRDWLDPESWLVFGGFPETDRDIQLYKKALWSDRCAYCGARVEVLDHIQARARGGGDSWENLTGACTTCNSRKKAKSLLGFLGGELERPRYEATKAALAGWSKV